METPKGQKYEGPSGVARESQWLISEDLIPGRDQKVKIETVQRYDNISFKSGNGPEQKKAIYLALKFVGKERELGLNRTNTKILNRMFGSLTRGWAGKDITLYVTQVMAFGEMKDCVRIRDTGSRAATAAEQFLDETEDEPKVVSLTSDVNGAAETPVTQEAVERVFGK